MNDNELDEWLRTHNNQLNAHINASIDIEARRRQVHAAVLGRHDAGIAPSEIQPSRPEAKSYQQQVRSWTWSRPPARRRRVTATRMSLLTALAACMLVFAAAGGVFVVSRSTANNQAGNATTKASVCAEALGLADLNPLVDPERLKARAADKERRLRELANHVADQDVKNSLFTLADSYVEIQKERIDDLGVVAAWAKRNADHLDALRKACV